MEWKDEISMIKKEGEKLVEEIYEEINVDENLKGEVIERSKLTSIARPLLKNVVEVYGNGARLFSNPSEYDICLNLKYDVNLMLRTVKEEFYAVYNYPLDDCLVEGVIMEGKTSKVNMPINVQNVKNKIIKFLKEYNRITAQIERNRIKQQMKPTVVIKTQA